MFSANSGSNHRCVSPFGSETMWFGRSIFDNWRSTAVPRESAMPDCGIQQPGGCACRDSQKYTVLAFHEVFADRAITCS